MLSEAEYEFLRTGRTLEGDDVVPRRRSQLNNAILKKTLQAISDIEYMLGSGYFDKKSRVRDRLQRLGVKPMPAKESEDVVVDFVPPEDDEEVQEFEPPQDDSPV